MYKNDSLWTERAYVGEFFYENDTLKFIQNEEGRVVVDVVNNELDYQYHLKDHLGNTRVTYSTTPESYVVKATMEDINYVVEDPLFEPYNPVQRNGPPAGNTSAKVARLNTNESGDGSTFNGQVELKSMFEVNKGDTLKLSVKAYYENDPIVDGMLSAAEMFAAILAGGEGGNVAGEGATLANSTLDESAVSAMNTNKSASSEDDVPKAFINYMLFDKDMTYITSGFIQISSGAKNLWETVEFPAPITIEQNGYALVYVSNETNAACVVDFDDLTIEHAKTPIVFASDYYPFGLEYNGFSRNYSQKVRFKFQEQEHDEETGWIAFKWRNHQPEIGRFFNVDPLAEDYYYNSPYAFSENAVTGHRELEGLEKLKVAISKFIYKENKDATITYDKSGKKHVKENGIYNKTLSKVPESGSNYDGMSFDYDISSGEISNKKYRETGGTWIDRVLDSFAFGDSNYVNHDLSSNENKNGSSLSGDFDGTDFKLSFNMDDGILNIQGSSEGADGGFVIKIGEVNGYSGFSVINGWLEKNKSIKVTVDDNNNVIFNNQEESDKKEEDEKEIPVSNKQN